MLWQFTLEDVHCLRLFSVALYSIFTPKKYTLKIDEIKDGEDMMYEERSKVEYPQIDTICMDIELSRLKSQRHWELDLKLMIYIRLFV